MSRRQVQPGRVPSTHFLVLEEALRTHETLAPMGFVLDRSCRVRALALHLHTCLIWRRVADGASAVLRVRIPLPRNPADG